MINIYEKMHDSNGDRIEGRSKLFISETDSEGNLLRFEFGIGVSPTESGTLFIVDGFIHDQIDKLKLVDGVLSVKDGEQLIAPELTEEEKEIIELRKRLEELEGY